MAIHEVKAPVRTMGPTVGRQRINSSNSLSLTAATLPAAPLVIAGDGIADPKKLEYGRHYIHPEHPSYGGDRSKRSAGSLRSRPRTIIS